MKSIRYIAIEFLVLFILLPIVLTLSFFLPAKIVLVLIGFIYAIVLLRKFDKIKFNVRDDINWSSFWKRTGVTFLLIVIVTTIYVYFVDTKALFYVPINKPAMFILILLIYSLFSVWPQEIIYRTFFMERYAVLFKNEKLLIFVNAIVFALGHLFFRNTLVLILTFIGGLIFGFTYLKFKSTTLVTIEHAVYGNWLFTVGMGQMLAFPGMEV